MSCRSAYLCREGGEERGEERVSVRGDGGRGHYLQGRERERKREGVYVREAWR